MTEKMKLKMPCTDDPKDRGINSGNYGTFAAAYPLFSVVKEEIQNSLDEAIERNGKPMKVVMDMQMYDLSTEMIPCIEELRKEVQNEISYWKEQKVNDYTEVEFFEKVNQLLTQPSIRVIRISDRNTKGLVNISGEKNRESSWKSLVMRVGVSDKSQTANGSHGVGKYAAFENSQTRIVFYATQNIEMETASIGVTMWPTYEANGHKYTGEGFVCDVNCESIHPEPLREWISLQPGYERGVFDFGTDKYIIGVDSTITEEEFEEQASISALNSYLLSFYLDKLELRCGNTIINQNTFGNIIERYQDKFLKYDAEKTLDYFDTLLNYDCSKSYSLKFNGEDDEETDVTFYLKMGAEKCRRCAVVRASGMKVFDKKNISSTGFSAVCVFESSRANAYFRKLEDNSHSNWVFSDPKVDKKDAIAKKNLLFSYLKDMIRDIDSSNNDESSDFDGLSKYLAMSYILNPEARKKVEAITDNIEEITKKMRLPKKLKIKKIKAKRSEKKEDIPAFDFIDGYGGEMFGHGPELDGGEETFVTHYHETFSQGGINDTYGNLSGIEGQEGDANIQTSKDSKKAFQFANEFPAEKIRFALKKSGEFYFLRFMSEEDISECCFSIKISGDSKKINVTVVDAAFDGNSALFDKNKIVAKNIRKNNKHTLRFRILEEGEWALEVKTYVR